MSLKQELKKARNRAGFTQQDVAAMTNIALGTLRRWEQGVNEPDTESLVTLLDLYRASADEVLGSGFYVEDAARSQRLSPDEQTLLDLYRSTDARGKAAIMRTAEGEAGVEGPSAADSVKVSIVHVYICCAAGCFRAFRASISRFSRL